jgi:small subunit ribosomal protein S17
MENTNENVVKEEVTQETVENSGSAGLRMENNETVATSTSVESTQTHKHSTGRRRVLEGRVVSDKPDKTIVVLVERYVQHPLYKKYYKRSKKFMAHDEKNECRVGDFVRIIEWRPLSRRKRWMLKEIVERAK